MMFKDKLKTLRLRSGMTQDELSARLFVSRTLVTKWETGARLPNRDNLCQLAEVLGVPVSELETDEFAQQDELSLLCDGTEAEEFLIRQTAKRISAYLRSLPKQERDLFVRRYYYRDTVPEAARFARMSEQAAAEKLTAVRQGLAEYLGKEETL